MDDDPAQGVRRKKDSTLVRAAEAVRDGKASAMVSAGNTGATMASALLRMGRIKGVSRPAIATPIPVPGLDARPSCSTPAPTPSASPSGWCSSPRWARSTPATASASTEPRVGLLSIGEEPGKGDTLRKEAYELLEAAPGHPLHRQRRGPRHHDRRRRRRRHRRLHRQRRAEDARGRRCRPLVGALLEAFGADPTLPGRTPTRCCRRCCRSTRRSTPTPTAARCCSASTACASSATARRRRDGDASTRIRSPTRWSTSGIVDEIRAVLS